MSAGGRGGKRRPAGKTPAAKKSSPRLRPKPATKSAKKPPARKQKAKKPAARKLKAQKPAARTQKASTQAPRTPTSLADRRGIRQSKDGWFSLLVHAPGGTADADVLLGAMLASGWIGAARRDVTADLPAGKVRRPMGPWGLVVQLKGQPWLHVLGDGLRYEWAKQLAQKLGRRAALFEFSGLHGTLYARAYDGDQTLFEFECGGFVDDKDPGAVRPPKEPFAMKIGGASHDADWLRQFKSGGAAQDALARELGAYVPQFYRTSDEGAAVLVGQDGAAFKPSDYARIDLVVFGDASTLEPTEASLALTKAIEAGDAGGVRAALAAGADVRYLPDGDASPLDAALALGLGGTYDWLYKRVTRAQQLDVVAALLESGADPKPKDAEPPIHQVISRNERGDERTVVRLLHLLLDHGADPNAAGTFLRSAGNRPLHVVAVHNGWLAVLKLLVSRGADPKLTNLAGKTPSQAAEARLEYLRQSRAKAGPDALLGMLGNIMARGAGADAARQAAALQSAMSGVLGDAVREATTEQDHELLRLEKAIEFLAAAERGDADTSDVDELAEASWQAWLKHHEQWKARRKAESPALWRELHGDDA